MSLIKSIFYKIDTGEIVVIADQYQGDEMLNNFKKPNEYSYLLLECSDEILKDINSYKVKNNKLIKGE